MIMTRIAILVSFAAGGVLAASHAAAAGATVPGDRWEITSQMSMEGMPMAMPPNKVKICAPKEWTEPPGGADPRMHCTNSNFRREGNKAMWDVTCAGPPAMTGTGEITRESDDAWAGVIKFSGSEGAMTINISGKKLEDCEARP